MATLSELDNPVWHALNGPHARFGLSTSRAARYSAAVSPFAALTDPLNDRGWSELNDLARDEPIALVGINKLPEGWIELGRYRSFQMIETDRYKARRAGPILHSLGSADAPEMLQLAKRTEPGPFAPKTVELGSYFGVRDAEGRLVAMAGERMATGSWREVSAVCTDLDHRGRGYASALVAAVVEDIRNRGERAFLHVFGANPARDLYAAWGFETRREVDIVVTRAVTEKDRF